MFALISCGHQYTHPQGITINRPGGAGNYAFVFFRTPSRVLLGDAVAPAPANSYVLFRPNTPQFYCHERLPFVNDWFHCEGEGLESFLRDIRFPLDTLVPARDPMLLSRGILELGAALRQGGSLSRLIVDNELKGFFLRLRAACEYAGPGEKRGRYYRPLLALRNEIYSSPGARRSVAELSQEMCLSKSYFQHVYKELFGVSIVHDMIASRLEYARYLLQTGSYTVGQVAAMCGYENNIHFIRQFKKAVGVTPGRYGL